MLTIDEWFADWVSKSKILDFLIGDLGQPKSGIEQRFADFALNSGRNVFRPAPELADVQPFTVGTSRVTLDVPPVLPLKRLNESGLHCAFPPALRIHPHGNPVHDPAG